jgi:hypothetical protein
VLAGTAVRSIFTPDLRPFQQLLRDLRGSSKYAKAGLWKLTPTLMRTHDTFIFWKRTANARVDKVSLPRRPSLDVVLDVLSQAGVSTFHCLTERLAAEVEVTPAQAEGVLLLLVDHGLLVGGLDLAVRFESPWQALSDAARWLLPPERAAWLSAYRQLRRICRACSSATEVDGDPLGESLAQAAAIVEALAKSLGLVCPDLPRTLLRCDSSLSASFTLDREFRSKMAAALEEYLEFQARAGLGYALRSDLNAIQMGAIAGSARLAELPQGAFDSHREVPSTWEDYAEGAGRATKERVDLWATLIDGAPTARASASWSAGGPFGCFLFGITPDGRVIVHGVVDELATVYARYAQLFKTHAASMQSHTLCAWYRAQVTAVELRTGIRIAELLTPCEINPNALARPTLAPRAVGLWCCTSDEEALTDVRVASDPVTQTPLLFSSTLVAREPLATFSFSSANVGWGDPVSLYILSTSFRAVQLAHLRSDTLPFRRELTRESASAEVRLEKGTVLRSRRLVLAGRALNDWLALSGPARYCHFIGLATDEGLGPWVVLRRDQGAGLLLPMSSPLAVEAALEGARGCSTLTIENFSDEAWLRDEQGQRHVVEFAVPFVRRRHAWSARAAHCAGVDAGECTAHTGAP